MLLLKQQKELARYLNPVMDPIFNGRGNWANIPTYRVVMSLIRKLPRDLVKLCTFAARNSCKRKSNLIQTEDFSAIFEEYSQGRIQDTINEYRSELPDIEILLMNMKPNQKERTAKQGYVYTTSELIAKISNITAQRNFVFANGSVGKDKDLAVFLYKINFLTARKENIQGIERKYFEENRYLMSSFVDFGFDWEIHPAYRWALQPTNQDEIFSSLQLSVD
jgi:hypothetical protein